MESLRTHNAPRRGAMTKESSFEKSAVNDYDAGGGEIANFSKKLKKARRMKRTTLVDLKSLIFLRCAACEGYRNIRPL